MLPPDSDAELPAEVVPLTPDVMARILEPRVRSNAKNNSKIAKVAAAKKMLGLDSADAPEIEPKIAPEIELDLTPETPPASDRAPQISLAPEAASLPVFPPIAAPEPAENEVLPALSELRELLLSIQETQENRDRAFDLLYDELSGYKNDFYLERLKPSLRALLFLLDSIEGFERELLDYDGRGDAVLIKLVKANLVHFRDQLVDVLTILELTPIESEDAKFDPKTQRAVEVVPVEAEQNNTVQRQIRGGWRLGGKMLRAADVVVGRSG